MRHTSLRATNVADLMQGMLLVCDFLVERGFAPLYSIYHPYSCLHNSHTRVCMHATPSIHTHLLCCRQSPTSTITNQSLIFHLINSSPHIPSPITHPYSIISTLRYQTAVSNQFLKLPTRTRLFNHHRSIELTKASYQ